MNTQVKDLLEQVKNFSENERILLADLLSSTVIQYKAI